MEANVNLFALLAKQARIQGINLGHHRAFEDFNKALDQINIDPVIDTVYSFDQAKEVYEHQMEGAFGKIVIDFNKSPLFSILIIMVLLQSKKYS